MATTTLDYDEAKKQLREAYRNKTIDYTQYRQSIDVINQKQNLGEPVEIEVEDVEIELEKPMSEMIGALRRPEEPVEIEEPEELTAPAISLMRDREEVVAPRVERIMPYRFGEKADPLSARNKYINTMEQVYQITYGNSPEEAKRKARADADKYMKGTTSEFYDAPQFMESNIVDIEKGLLRDRETGEIREGSYPELAAEAFKRQIVGKSEDYTLQQANLLLEQRIREQRRKEAREERAKSPSYILTPGTTKPRFMVEADIRAGELREDIASDVGRAAQLALVKPRPETGVVYETPLAATMRGGLNLAPAVISSAIQPLMPGTIETDDYRMADSADVADQILVNIAKGQGLPQLFDANVYLKTTLSNTPIGGVAEFVTGDREDAAWMFGFGSEIGVPITGIPTAYKFVYKPTAAAARATARAVGPRTGEVVAAVTAPIEYTKMKGLMSVVDDYLGEGTSAAIKDEFYSGKISWNDWIDSSAARRSIRENSSEAVAERVVAVNMLRSIVDNQDIAVKNLGFMLENPTTKGILLEAGIKIDDPAAVVTKDLLDDILIREAKKLENAARGNSDFARIYNKGEAIQKQTSEMLEKAYGFEEVPKLNTTRLTTQFQSELVRTALAKSLATDKNLYNQVFDTLRTGTKSGRQQLQKALEDIVGDVYSYQDLDVIYEAFKKDVRRDVADNLLNFLPEDLIAIGADVVVPRKSWTKAKKHNAFYNDLKGKNANLKYDPSDKKWNITGSNEEKKKVVNEILDHIIDYAGVDTVRKSEVYQDLISQLQFGTYDQKYHQIIQEAFIARSAEKHLDGFRMRAGGEQFRRAAQGEFRGDILAVSEEREFAKQLKKGAMGDFIRDIRVSRQAIKAQQSASPTIKPVVGVTPPPQFLNLTRRVEAKIDQVSDQFDTELKRLSKEYGNPIDALDEMTETAWKVTEAETIRITDELVERGFQGDWEAYLNTFVEKRYRDQIKSLIDREYGGMKNVTDDELKDLIYEYRLYFNKSDQWKALLSTYYGSDYVKIAIDENPFHTEFIRKLYGVSEADRRLEVFASRGSTVLDINYSNFLEVINRIEQEPLFKGTGLKTVGLAGINRKEATSLPIQEYILGIRQSQVVNDEMKAFIQTNPEYGVDMIPNYLGSDLQLNLQPLTNVYDNIIDDAVDEFAQAAFGGKEGDPAGLFAAQAKRQNAGSLLADVHFNTMSKIGTKTRDDLRKWVQGVWGGQNIGQRTLKPDLTTARDQLQQILAEPYIAVNNTVDDLFDRIFQPIAEMGIPQNVRNNIVNDVKEKIWDIYFKGFPVDGRYYADPGMGVMEDVLRNTEDFFKANGVAVGDDIVSALNSNLPMFTKIQGTNIAMMYGAGMAKTIDNLETLAKTTKLRTTLERLRIKDDDKLALIGATIGSATEAFRRIATGGLLAGIYVPVTRYLGQNIFNANIIMAGTLGPERSFRGGLASPMHMKAIAISKYPDDAVVFTSKGGREYTAAELRQLESTYNLGLSRFKVELQERTATRTMTDVGRDLSGKPLTTPSWLWSKIRPDQRGLWSTLADNQDQTFRRATFYTALQDDVPLEQAIAISKRSLLDYGSIGRQERSLFEKYVFFWSFTRQITTELINLTAKAVTQNLGHNFVAKVARASMRQQQQSAAWLYNDDRAKSRMYSFYKGMIDNLPLFTYGFSNPYVESYETLLMLGTRTIGLLGIGEPSTAVAVEKLIGGINLRPEFEFLLQVVQDRYSKKVPPEDIYLLKGTAMWPFYKELFELSPIDPKRRRPQDPTFSNEFDQQQQYKMTKSGARKYAAFSVATLLMGVNRIPKDYTKALMAKDQDDESLRKQQLRRFASPNVLLYLLGAETSLRSVDERELIKRNEFRIQKIFNELTRERKK
tara:strand:- start:5553 stop:11159 length:5607 start_codon:yes stop_codon:yes gene_type:complete